MKDGKIDPVRRYLQAAQELDSAMTELHFDTWSKKRVERVVQDELFRHRPAPGAGAIQKVAL